MKSKTYFLLAVSLSLCVSSLFANTILETQNQNIQYRFNTFNNPNIFGSDCSNKNDFISDSQFVINSITVSQYCDFLNAVAMADTYHLYDEQMASDSINASIVRSGSPNNYTYSVIDGTGDKLITFVSQISAIRYCNWIQNGQLNGKEGVASCENGTYTLNENGIIDINLNSNYFLRNENRETFLTIPFSTSNLIANKYPNHNFCMVEKINSPLPQMQMNSAELTVQEVEKGLKRVISEDKLLPSAEANISNIASIGRSRENHTSFSSIPAATSSSIAEEESDEVADDLTEENYSMSQFVEDTVVVVQDRINVYTEAIASIDQAEKIKKDFIVRALDFINESESVPEDLNKKLQNIITVPATGDIEPIVVSEVQGLKVLKKESTVSISPKDQKEEVVAALAFKKELSKFQNKVNVEEILTPAQHQLIQASLEKCERRQREVRTATAEVMERAREAREQVQRDHRKATALYEDEKQCWWPPSKNAKRSEAEACEKSIVLKRTEAEALETVYASFIKSSDYLGKAIELLTQGNKDRANFWIMKANVEEVKICATKPCDDNWKVKRDRANELVTMIRNKVWPTVSQAMKAFKNHPSIERMGIVREVASASASAYACAFAFASASSFVSSDAYANAYASAYVSAHAHASVSDFAFDPA
ncbi:MAG TPA: hypothetical protein VJK54_09510, partial [Chthoniobacterales bacterium]|nr:hypothetical protein [Chthoniobacterales bacterium]